MIACVGRSVRPQRPGGAPRPPRQSFLYLRVILTEASKPQKMVVETALYYLEVYHCQSPLFRNILPPTLTCMVQFCRNVLTECNIYPHTPAVLGKLLYKCN